MFVSMTVQIGIQPTVWRVRYYFSDLPCDYIRSMGSVSPYWSRVTIFTSKGREIEEDLHDVLQTANAVTCFLRVLLHPEVLF